MKQILIERQGYSERIERMFGRGMVVVLTGQRRVGKSCVMRRICDKYLYLRNFLKLQAL